MSHEPMDPREAQISGPGWSVTDPRLAYIKRQEQKEREEAIGAEKRDAAMLKDKLANMRETTLFLLRELDRATPDELKYMGYSKLSNAEAMRKAFQHHLKQTEKLITEHERKYPS